MLDEELKKAMIKIFVVVAIILLIMIILSVIIFNKFGKNPTVFENDEQKERYEKILEEKNKEDISENDIGEINNNIESLVENQNIEQ